MIIYPVAIPTLCRYEHFKRTVESLSKCSLAEKTELVLGIDYPLNKKHEEGHNKIKEYVKTINGFKKVTVFYADRNLGQSENLRRLKEYVKCTYDAWIFTEDDNVFSPCFLEFMNISLNELKNNKKIFAVTGYSPIEYENMTKNPIVLSRYAFMWGCGVWFDRSSPLQFSECDSICRDLGKSFRVFKEQPAALGMFLVMLKRKQSYGDIIRTIENVLNDRYFLMPSLSMVRNIGQDGSGQHSGVNYKIQNQMISSKYHCSYTQDDFERALGEIKTFKYKRKSFFIMLSSNKFKAILQIIKIVFRWIFYRF